MITTTTYRAVDVQVSGIINALLQRNIQRVILPLTSASLLQVSRARKEVSIPMETDRHHSISCVERLFYTIAMMYIDVDIQDSIMIFEKLKDSQHYIIDVAEATGLLLFSVMQATCPIDGDVSRTMVQFDGSVN